MLEQSEKQSPEKREASDEKQIFRNTVSGFIDSIPEDGPLYEKGEKREMTTRAIDFGRLYNQLSIIAEGSRNLNQEQRAKVAKRIEALRKEAYFWTTQTDSGRNFAEEVKEMAQAIWRR